MAKEKFDHNVINLIDPSMINIVNLTNITDIESWLKDDKNIYVGRANNIIGRANNIIRYWKWGNPYKLHEFNNNRQLVVKLYTKYILTNSCLASTVSELKGKVLGCWCAPKLCHAEVLHKLAGNIPKYENMANMVHNHYTRKSNPSEKPPPISPKPVVVKPVKLNTAQLQEKVEQLELQVIQLLEDSKEKDRKLKKMEDRVLQLEADEMRNASYFSVQRNVSNLLSNRIAQLEQYTRRYSVIVSGIERKAGENKDSLRTEVDSLLQEAGSTAKVNDVDKLHRNGPRKGTQQDIIVRFKSHEAKEAFYKHRKNIKSRQVWVKPSLSYHNSDLLSKAKELVKGITADAQTYNNPPEFVFANVHGDLQVKLAKNTRDGTMFYSFNSIPNLLEILNKADDPAAFLVSDEDRSRFDKPKDVFPRSHSEMAAMDARWAEEAARRNVETDESKHELSLAEVVENSIASTAGSVSATVTDSAGS